MTRAAGRLVATALALALVGGCAARQSGPSSVDAHGTAAGPAAASGLAADAAVAEAVDRRMTAVEALALWSVRIERADTGAVIASRNAERLMLPASNMKIVTLAAAATRLGWDYRFRTRVHATGRRDGHVLHGDLVVVGGADPTIGHGPDPRAVFRDWARQLRAQRIQRIEGDLVGDPSRFGEEWLGGGWSWDDLGFGYAAPYSGLIFTENVTRVRVTPAASEGGAATVTLGPPGTGLALRADVTTSAAGATTAVRVHRTLEQPIIEITGSVAAGDSPVERTVAVPDPPRYFLGVLRTVLASEGIEVRGRTRVATTLDAALGPPVLTHESAPLSVVAQRFMKVSQNLYGEVLLRAVAARAGGPASPTSVRTALQESLDGLGVARGAVSALDGSGLSRRDFVTSQALITLLRAMDAPPHREPFRATMPIAGRDGTLATRFEGNACAGRLLGKTGTLANTRALSGYITSASGTPYVFSVMANNFVVATREIDTIVEDVLGLVCAS